jgi:hypothetical protein
MGRMGELVRIWKYEIHAIDISIIDIKGSGYAISIKLRLVRFELFDWNFRAVFNHLKCRIPIHNNRIII